jgi:hypothetical protein
VSTECPARPAADGPTNGAAEPPAPQSKKRARGGQPGNSNALKHGTYRRRRALNDIDWPTQLDRRTTLYRELRERAALIVRYAGGAEAIGPQRAALAPFAAQLALELETLNAAILTVGPVDKRRHAARKIVEDRNKLLRTYRELLATIGLDDGLVGDVASGALWDELARRNGSGAVQRTVRATSRSGPMPSSRSRRATSYPSIPGMRTSQGRSWVATRRRPRDLPSPSAALHGVAPK